jgi:uncharacterized protein (UPF0332 family)
VTADDVGLALAQRELDESWREWSAARLLADGAFHRQAITRLYFAAFRAAQGLLAAHGIEVSTHEGVQRLLGLHFVLRGLLPKEAGRSLSALLSRRHEADDRLLVDVDQTVWDAAHAEALTFFAAARQYLAQAWPRLSLRIDSQAR